jgi:hypothetical protein
MATVQAPGGGVIDSGDKRVERKVVVSTAGRPRVPGGRGVLTAVSITEEPGGIQRGVFEYTEGGLGDASYNQYGKRIELMGGTREVPIYNHPNFNTLTAEQILEVQEAVENKEIKAFTTNAQNNLYQCLIRKIEYYLAPSLVARISEIESSLPSTSDLAKLGTPQGVSAPPNTRWVVTGISATPVGGKYEVTREYTLVQDPEAADFLYNNATI